MNASVTSALIDYKKNRRVDDLFPVVNRLSKVIAYQCNRKDLAEDIAQEFWLRADKMAHQFNPDLAPAEPYMMGWLRKIAQEISRHNPLPVEDPIIEEDVHESIEASYCAEERLDRKLAISAIQKRMESAMSNPHVSPLPFVTLGASAPLPPSVSLEPPKVAKPKKARGTKNADHLRIREIRTRLDMTQGAFADRLGLVTVTLVSYERGQTKSVPKEVMERAEELMRNEGEVLEWRKRFEGRSMIEILDDWAKELGADATDLPTMAALTGTVTSTVSRWRNGECRPTLREIVAYDRNVQINAKRLRKSGLLIETQMTRESAEPVV